MLPREQNVCAVKPVERATSQRAFEKLHADIKRFSCIEGFQHFDMELLSREEVLVTIKEGPKEKESHTCATCGHNAPPSPIYSSTSSSSTVALIGAYEHYRQPFVWLRNNHSKYIEREANYNDPLFLTCIDIWFASDIFLFDILEEVILKLKARPRPANPFAVDFNLLSKLPRLEQALQEGALMAFLRKILLVRPPPGKYGESMLADFQHLSSLHFKHLSTLWPARRSSTLSARSEDA